MNNRTTFLLSRLVTTRIAWPLLLAIALLCTVSVLALQMFPADEARAQEMHIALGAFVMFAIVLVNYQWIGRFSFAALALVVVLLAAVLFTTPIKGSTRWFLLPGMAGTQLQPSELAKITFVLALAWFLRFRRHQHGLAGLLVPFLIMLVPMGLILIEPDLGTALLFPPTLYAMLLAAGARIRHLLLITVIVILSLPGLFPILHPYQQQRIIDMLDRVRTATTQSAAPSEYNDTRYQQHRSEVTLGAGGMWGQGFQGGAMVQRGLLPEADTDFIFAVVGTQWGFVGCAGVLFLYLAFYGAALEIAGSTKEPFGRLVAVGLSTMILFQAIINIAMAVGLCPVVGIALPFISYGGSSLVVNMIAAGVLLNISVRRSTTAAATRFASSAA